MSTILESLQSVFQEVFDDEDIIVTETTSAADIETWDSLKHVSLLLKVEEQFAIRFSSSEIADLKDVGGLAALIETKQEG